MQIASQADFRIMDLAFTGWVLRWRVKRDRRTEAWQRQVALVAFAGRTRLKAMRAWQAVVAAAREQRQRLQCKGDAFAAWRAYAREARSSSGWYSAWCKLRRGGHRNEVRVRILALVARSMAQGHLIENYS